MTLNEEAAYLIGAAFVDWLADKKGKKPSELSIAVGRDPRLSGPALANAMFAGFGSKDVGRVVDMGIATTPACFMATVTPGVAYDAGIMLTASHLPFNRNGAKFFTSDGGLDKADIKRICEDAAAACQAAPDGHAIPLDGDDAVESVPFLEDYAAQLRDLIKKGANHPTAYDEPLTGMKIIVDAGNGSGGFFAKSVLEPLGADVYGSQFLDPDGKFPNHSPNPEDAEAMDSAVEATVKAKADLGVIFDTDVDRSAVIDGDGIRSTGTSPSRPRGDHPRRAPGEHGGDGQRHFGWTRRVHRGQGWQARAVHARLQERHQRGRAKGQGGRAVPPHD